MKREKEEVRISALKYLDNFISDDCGICKEDIYDAFMAGVDWADDNPRQDVVNLNDIWHDASEEPAGDDWVILCEDDSGNCFCQNKIIVVELFLNWQKSAEKVWLKRWAYVSDLLPKGGGE